MSFNKIFITILYIFTASNSMASINKCFSFDTERLTVRMLKLDDMDRALEVDNPSELTFVNVINHKDTQEFKNSIEFQENNLFSSYENLFNINDSNNLVRKEKKQNIYLGIFDKEDCIGLSSLIPENNNRGCYIHTFLKFHQSARGKGFGTEFKKGLINFLEAAKIIPREGVDDPLFSGLKGLVHFSNKASLKVNLKLNYQIGDFLGDRVEIYYPSAPSESSRGLNNEEKDLLNSLFNEYFDKNASDQKNNEGNLREFSLKRLIKFGDQEKIKNEVGFFVRTLSVYPKLIEFIDAKNKDSLKEEIKKMSEEIKNFTVPDMNQVQKTEVETFISNLDKVSSLLSSV